MRLAGKPLDDRSIEDDLIELTSRLARDGKPLTRKPLVCCWNEDRTLVMCGDAKTGELKLICNPDDFVKLGGVLPE